jgi:polyisoprenoid-binding protein YceI
VIDRADYGVAWNAPAADGRLVIGNEVTLTVELDLVLAT